MWPGSVCGGMVGEGRILQFWADKGGDMMGNKGQTSFHMNLGHPFPTFIYPIQKSEGLPNISFSFRGQYDENQGPFLAQNEC